MNKQTPWNQRRLWKPGLCRSSRHGTHLRWPTEQQPAGVEAVCPAFGSVAVVHVARPGYCPLPVVEGLFG